MRVQERYITKPLQCSRCEGTGLEKLEGRTTDCLMCNGRGERMVTLPKKEWEEMERDELSSRI